VDGDAADNDADAAAAAEWRRRPRRVGCHRPPRTQSVPSPVASSTAGAEATGADAAANDDADDDDNDDSDDPIDGADDSGGGGGGGGGGGAAVVSALVAWADDDVSHTHSQSTLLGRRSSAAWAAVAAGSEALVPVSAMASSWLLCNATRLAQCRQHTHTGMFAQRRRRTLQTAYAGRMVTTRRVCASPSVRAAGRGALAARLDGQNERAMTESSVGTTRWEAYPDNPCRKSCPALKVVRQDMPDWVSMSPYRTE
jgi:hypothetical protein